MNYLDHNRSYSLTAVVTKNEKLSFQAAYTYNNVLSLADVCFPIAFFVPPGSTPCPSDPTSGLVGANSTYNSTVYYVYGGVMWKPIKRVSTTFGYSGTFTKGHVFFLDPTSGATVPTTTPPGGTLQYNYTQPYATVDVYLGHGVTYKTAWNYYNYDEKQPPGLVGSRNFISNLATFALKYVF